MFETSTPDRRQHTEPRIFGMRRQHRIDRITRISSSKQEESKMPSNDLTHVFSSSASLRVEIQTPYWPLSGTASSRDFEARSRASIASTWRRNGEHSLASSEGCMLIECNPSRSSPSPIKMYILDLSDGRIAQLSRKCLIGWHVARA